VTARLPGAVAGLAALAGLCVAPYAGRMLSPDEGGLLLLADQWSPGASLYGDYFVDRPPGLIALFALADALGGSAWAVRLLGIAAVVASVLLAGLVGRAAGAPPFLPALTAAILVVTPLFGGTVVNGELLGLPFLIGGCAAVLIAARSDRWLAWAALAGVLGAAGALVKQSLLDVFVLAVVLLLARRRFAALGVVVAAALVTAAVAVGGAALRGTAPAELWDAVVVFRQQAAAVIAASATDTTTTRLGAMLLALLATGAPLLVVALVRRARGAELLWPAVAVLAWELFVVLGGGSYWLHYLMGLVPGLVLLAAAAAQRSPRPGRLLATAYAVSGVSAVAALVVVAVQPIERPERPAIAWLEEHAEPGDTAVVAFGGPNILRTTGLRSPYPDLWSLPVRVHDPDLVALTALLRSADRPTWLVVAGESLGSWGIDATVADEVLADHYAHATTAGDWTIYREDDA
jgi:dolichyl-phosphate-mannose-protein mannosyltransferase